MTKARDLANIISGGFTADDIPNLDASKITSGSLGVDRIPNLAASKITSGTFADGRIASSNVSQHATSFDDNDLVNDISTLGLRIHTQENLNASNTNSASFDVFQDSSGITNLTNALRNASEYIDTTSTSDDDCDFLSNGVKMRCSNNGSNGSNANYVYMAFAEAPLVGTNNIPCTAR